MGRLVRACQYCNYYHSDKEDAKIGECRRQCPMAISGSSPAFSARVWPCVLPKDWCGDYAPIRDGQRES